jgi:hypothetical protein
MPRKKKKTPSARTQESAPLTGLHKQENAGKSAELEQVDKPAEIEIGGSKGLEPTRYGDWERNGRCTDF